MQPDEVEPVDTHKRAVDGFWNIPRMVRGRWPPGYGEHLEPYAASVHLRCR